MPINIHQSEGSVWKPTEKRRYQVFEQSDLKGAKQSRSGTLKFVRLLHEEEFLIREDAVTGSGVDLRSLSMTSEI